MLAGALELQMFANLARLASDMHQAKGMVGGAMKSIEGAVASAKSALGALGIGLGVGYFASLIKGSIDAADHLRDLSKTTSISVEQLAGLKLAAKQSGGDLDSIAAAINKLAQNMGKDAEKFKALGVSAKDPLKAFQQLSDVFVAIQDPQQRAAVMAAALGKSWAGAAPLLSEGGQRIGEMVAKGTQLSGVTKDMADQADAFNDQMAELNTTMGATKTKLVGDLLPGMNEIAAAMREASKEGGILLTLWVGLGGVASNLILKTRLQEINEQLAILRNQLRPLKSGETGISLFSFFAPDILDGSALAKIRTQIDALEKEKARLISSAVTKPPGVDPASAAAAAAKAAAFLKGEEEAKKYAQLVKASESYIETLKKEAEQSGLNTIQQKMLAASYEALKAPTAALRMEIMAQAQAWALATQASLDDAEAKKIQEAGVKRLAEEEKQRLEKLKDAIDADQKQLDAMKLANAEFGKSAEQIAEMNLAKLELTLSTLDFAAATWEEVAALEKRLEIARQMVGAAGQNDILRANDEIEKKRREEAKRTADLIETSLTDALMRGFESGKDFARNFRDTLVNLFKTLVLQPSIKFIVSSVGGALGLPGLAAAASGAAGGGGGGLSGLSSLTSLFGGNSIGQSLMGAGDWMVRNNVLSSAGWQLSANAGMIPNWQFGLAGLGGGLLGGAIGGKTGSMLGGFGAGLGMAFGPWGALAGAVGGGVLGKVFGGGGDKPKKLGYQATGTFGLEGLQDGLGYKLYNTGAKLYTRNIAGGTWGAGPAADFLASSMRSMLTMAEQLGLGQSSLARELAALRIPFNVQIGKGPGMPQALMKAAQEAATALEQRFIPALQQMAEAIKQFTSREQELLTRDLPELVRDVRGKLGIETLLDAQRGLAIAEFQAPLDRIAAVRAQLGATFASGMGGDLSAVNAFPALLQSALTIGRDVFASGAGFQGLFLEGNRMLNGLLSRQRDLETDILADVPLTIQQAAQDQIAAIRVQTNALVAELRLVRDELSRLREAA